MTFEEQFNALRFLVMQQAADLETLKLEVQKQNAPAQSK